MIATKVNQRASVRTGLPSVRLSVVPSMIRFVRGLQWGVAALCVAASVLTGWMWWNRQTIEQEATRYESAAARTEAFNQQLSAQLEREHLTLTAAQITAIQEDVVFINQLAEKRRFSWTQLLHDLEGAFPAGTSIGKIQRDAKASTITVDGQAAGMQELRALMTRLETSPAFRQPVLHQHQLEASSSGDGERGGSRVEFSVTVEYRGLPERGQPDAHS